MASLGIRYSTIAALMASPIVACAAVAILTWFVLPGLGLSEWRVAQGVFQRAALVAVPATVLLGPFVFTFMQERNWRHWFHYFLAGAIIAVGVTSLLMVFAAATGELQRRPLLAAILSIWGLPVGVLTALVGWAIRRPDRDHNKKMHS